MHGLVPAAAQLASRAHVMVVGDSMVQGCIVIGVLQPSGPTANVTKAYKFARSKGDDLH